MKDDKRKNAATTDFDFASGLETDTFYIFRIHKYLHVPPNTEIPHPSREATDSMETQLEEI